MGVEEVRELPLKTFWMLHKNIDRIYAERDMRSTELMIKTQSSEGVKSLLEDLRKSYGAVIEIDVAATAMREKLDRKGLTSLKSKGTFR
jgi:hypothetical protein